MSKSNSRYICLHTYILTAIPITSLNYPSYIMLWSLTIDFRLCHSQNTDRMIIEEKFRSIVSGLMHRLDSKKLSLGKKYRETK